MADDDFREENVADIDFSQIRTSIQLGGRMIEHILNGVHYGSPEVRCLLLDECDIILECKVCRGLFRALPNFVAHKRVYCKQAYVITQEKLFQNLPEEDVVVVEPSAPEDPVQEAMDSGSQSIQSADDRARCTLQQIAEGKLGKSQMYKLYSKAADKIVKQKKTKKSLDVVLSKIASNPHAVNVTYQEHIPTCETTMETTKLNQVAETEACFEQSFTKSCDSLDSTDKGFENSETPNIDYIQDFSEDSRKHDALEKGETTDHESDNKGDLQANSEECRKSLSPPSSREPIFPDNLDAEKSSLKCHQCNTNYSSRKTLLYHVQMRHSGLRTFFPCPYCSNVFFYFWGLTRHLRVHHKKTPNQINKMRKALRGAAFTKTVTKPCIQAKNQLAFTTEMDTSCNEVTNETSDVQEQIKLDTGVQYSKAMVKHTSKTAKHTFASRYVPQVGGTAAVPVQRNSQLEEKEESQKRYSHQLVCECCQKVFWKKNRLANHKKFCPLSGKLASDKLQHPLEKHACSCGRTFLKKRSYERHALFCLEKEKEDRREKLEVNKVKSSVILCCPNCKRAFEKKISLVNHKRSCLKAKARHSEDGTFDSKSVGSSMKHHLPYQTANPTRKRRGILDEEGKCLKEKNGSFKEDIRVVEEIWIQKKPGQPSEKVKSSRVYVIEGESGEALTPQDAKKVNAMVDGTALKCKKCAQDFTDVYNLYCHAFRHLEWKRYKCKLCHFSSYNMSECNTHVVKVHSENTSTGVLVVDLNKEATKALSQKNVYSDNNIVIQENLDCEKRTISSTKTNIKEIKTIDHLSMHEVDHSRKFNISTRNSPRKFDTRPYKKLDNMSTLFTRKGYYPKQDYQLLKTNETSKIPGGDSSKTVEILAPDTAAEHVINGEAALSSKPIKFIEANSVTLSEIAEEEQKTEEKIRKKSKFDGTVCQKKLPKLRRSEENGCQLQKSQQSNLDPKSSDLLAPWPRSPEPMSVKEMFALIRRSPRTGSVGAGRRKSVGDLPMTKPREQTAAGTDSIQVQQPLEDRKSQETRNNLGATVSRKGSPSSNNLSLCLRTSRPGVDWSQDGKK